MGYTDTPSLLTSHEERPTRAQVRLLIKRAWRLYDSLASWESHNLSCAIVAPLFAVDSAAPDPHAPRARAKTLEGNADGHEQTETHAHAVPCHPRRLQGFYKLKFAARLGNERNVRIRGGFLSLAFLALNEC